MATDSAPETTFEDALRQLERVVDDLERGESDLTTALKGYETGVGLLARCQAELDRAERSVALLTGVDETGRPQTMPFDAAATLNAPPPAAKTRTKPRAKPATPPADADDFIPF